MWSQLLMVLWHVAAALAGEILVNFDPTLEGRVGTHAEVEESVGRVYGQRKFSNVLGDSEIGREPDAVDARSLLGGEVEMGAMMEKRQTTCPPGYGYCSYFGRCCPQDTLCCAWGYCLDQGDACCPSGPCPAGQECCGENHCSPVGSACCSDGTYCPAGNNCYTYPDETDPVCCTNNQCTAYVEEDGSTSYASTSTSTRTYTVTSTQYYYWTVTWWYWYYYWSYSVAIEASIVTSSRSTTSSTFSVETTDADAASSYFSDLSETLTLPTPGSATELEGLAGSTSFVEETTEVPESTSAPPPPPPPPSNTPEEDGSSSSTSSRPSSSSSRSSSSSESRSSSNAGPQSTEVVENVAPRAALFHLDGFITAYLMLVGGVGMVAVLL